MWVEAIIYALVFIVGAIGLRLTWQRADFGLPDLSENRPSALLTRSPRFAELRQEVRDKTELGGWLILAGACGLLIAVMAVVFVMAVNGLMEALTLSDRLVAVAEGLTTWLQSYIGEFWTAIVALSFVGLVAAWWCWHVMRACLALGLKLGGGQKGRDHEAEDS